MCKKVLGGNKPIYQTSLFAQKIPLTQLIFGTKKLNQKNKYEEEGDSTHI